MNLDDVLLLKKELKEKSRHPLWAERVLGGPPTTTRTVTTPGAGTMEMSTPHPDLAELTDAADAAHTRPVDTVNYSMGVVAGLQAGTFALSVRIHAEGDEALAIHRHVSATATGKAPVDVRIIPRIAKRPMANPPGTGWVQSLQRPVTSGLSVGCLGINAGTIGMVLPDLNSVAMLSNNHIFADVNKEQPGSPIIQPGPIDAGGPTINYVKFLVGVLDRFVPISFIRANLVDCAVAHVLDTVQHEVLHSIAMDAHEKIKGYKPIGFEDIGRKVWKMGKGTGFTEGTITAVGADHVKVDMGEAGAPAIALFSDQFEVRHVDENKAFSAHGDSGSVIFDEDNYARGLLFAGGADTNGVDHTYANRMDYVVKLAGLDLVKG